MPFFRKRSTRAVGQEGEHLAEQFLKSRCHTILERNFRTFLGEIDLISWDKKAKTLCFVEVKKLSFGQEELAGKISQAKRQKIIRSAYIFLSLKKLSPEKTSVRFDVIAAYPKDKGEDSPATWQIVHYPGAFTA